MAYIDFPDGNKGMKQRKEFWLSDDGIKLVAGWRREGIAMDEIGLRYIGIGTTTMLRWRQESKKFNDALRVSQDINNAEVEAALLKRALGYDDYDEVWELVEGEMRKVRVMVKHVPPDVKACLSWLYSRRSDRWRATQDPVDDTVKELDTAKKILVAIKEVADSGNTSAAKPETD